MSLVQYLRAPGARALVIGRLYVVVGRCGFAFGVTEFRERWFSLPEGIGYWRTMPPGSRHPVTGEILR